MRGLTLRRDGEHGVVLVTVVLLLLVLTALGMAAAVMMTQEDRSSSRAELAKEAFYVAEAGLRRGEAVVNLIPASAPTLADVFTYTPVGTCVAIVPDQPSRPTTSWDVAHLGTFLRDAGTAGNELNNVNVTGIFSLRGRRAFYTLLVRNNENDGGGSTNIDTKLRLISVGWIANGNNEPLAVKILEEEIDLSSTGSTITGQKQSDQGGTGSGVYGS